MEKIENSRETLRMLILREDDEILLKNKKNNFKMKFKLYDYIYEKYITRVSSITDSNVNKNAFLYARNRNGSHTFQK